MRAVRGLLENGLPASSLDFVTRDPTKAAAKTLAGLGLSAVIADLDDTNSLEAAAERGYGAVYVHGTSGDEKQIDAREVPRAEALAGVLAAAGVF